jgi:acetyl-CoA carboxylase biotin carboxyl carrier protein
VAVQVSAAPAIEDLAKHPGVITSPMVGVAYLSAEPGSAAFVTIGQTISAGQTVMLIEAMKTFNQIKAPKSGTLTRILINPGQPVEYGEPLMIVE